MKKLPIFIALFAFLLAAVASAQEFKLPIRMTGKLGFDKTVTMGYDPSASDAYNAHDSAAYAELPDYPGGIGFGSDMFLRRPDLTSTLIDIRRKPDSVNFSIAYSLFVSAEAERLPITLSWNPSTIPSAVQSITVAPAQAPSHIYADLKQRSSITIDADSISPYSRLTVTINYNSLASVEANSGSVAGMHASNNPMRSSTTLSFESRTANQYRLVAYDQAGRMIYSSELHAQPGMNAVRLTRGELGSVAGPIFLRRTSSGGLSETLRLIVE